MSAALAAAVVAAMAAPGAAQQQFEELGKRGLPGDRDRTRATALGDVDSDGDLDLVVGNLGQDRLYLNDGTGTFTDATAARMPVEEDWTSSLALVDVDGDGDLDLVVGNVGYRTGRRQNRLYLNDGSGTFTDETATRMPAHNDATTSLALGDVDGDGDVDLVFGNAHRYYVSRNRLYLNDGTGRFTDATASRMPVADQDTTSLALGDVDGDGDLDLVVGNGYDSGEQNRLYLNDGTGTFTDATATRMPAANDWTTSLVLGDLDADGDLDLVVGNGHYSGQQDRLYLNDGTGRFTDATATHMPVANDFTTSLVLGDVDADGDLDLVVGKSYRAPQNRLYLNDGTGKFTDATATRMPVARDLTTSLVLGDVDGDGDLDLAVGNGRRSGGEQNRLHLNDGGGRFTDATASRMPVAHDFTRSLALGDVDGDGDPDLVVGNSHGGTYFGGQNRLYLNDGMGTFTDATAARMPVANSTTASLALGDVDGDGDLDLVIGNFLAEQNRLYLNDGTGTFTDATAIRMPVDNDQTRSLGFGDVDGDGDSDLVIGNLGQDRLYLNDGTGTFTDATAARMPADNYQNSSLALGDVDGDRDVDLVVGNKGYPGRQDRLYLNDGTGTFTDATAARMPVDNDITSSLALDDVDGDGDPDLVVGNFGQDRLYLNDGTGTFADATATRLPVDTDYTAALALGDVDEDGDLDLVAGNAIDQQDRLYLNDGTGTFADATAARLPVDNDGASSLALGDVDGDGELDLVVGNSGTVGQQSRLYLNLLRQLDAPLLLRIGRPYALQAYARYAPPSASTAALPFLATATASIPVPPFGTFGLAPAQTVALLPLVIPQPAGVASLSFTVPNIPASAGLSLYAQALIVPPALLTGVTGDVLLR